MVRARRRAVPLSAFAVVAAACVACRRSPPPPAEQAPPRDAAPGAIAAHDAGADDTSARTAADAGAIDPMSDADGDEETSPRAAKRTSGDLFAVAPAAADGSAEPVASRCAALEANERAFFARVSGSFSGPGRPPCVFEPPPAFGACRVHGKEAWALAFEEVEITWEKRTRGDPPHPGACDARGRWVVAHVAADGAVARISPRVLRTPRGNANYDATFGTEETSASVELAPVFDFDGDGSVEVRVTAAFHAHEAEPDGWDGILTHSGGRIALYEPALRFREPSRPRSVLTARDGALDAFAPDASAARGVHDESDCVFRDVDGDGRPDIVYRPYKKRVGSVFGFSLDEIEDLPFLAHALPSGRFATDDDVARRFALTTCPSRPRAIAVRGDAGDEAARMAQNAACARVWGQSAAAVLEGLGRVCARYAPDAPSADESPPGTCADWLAGFARATPPLVLSADAGPGDP